MEAQDWVRQSKFRRDLGYSESGFRKLRDQKLIEGVHYKRGANRTVWIHKSESMKVILNS